MSVRDWVIGCDTVAIGGDVTCSDDLDWVDFVNYARVCARASSITDA